MSKDGTLYIETNSKIHNLDGSIKFLMLIAWTICIFTFMDLRVFTGFFIVGISLLKVAKIPFKSIKPLFLFVLIFTIFNSLFLIVVTPEYGSELTGHSTYIFNFLGRGLTSETLWFALSLSMKYMAICPITLLFIFTTHPSKFASSLNKIGVSYKVAYAINIALRYIPDVQREFKNIMQAQEARGVAFKKGEASIFERVKNYNTVLIPLIISSLNKVEVISNAMNLRGFGRSKKRTWYAYKAFSKIDKLVLLFICIVLTFIVYLKLNYNLGFWYPFN